MLSQLFFLLVVFVLIQADASHIQSQSPGSLSCLNEKGSPVDWWIVIKYPILSDHANPHYQDGYGYMYMDATHQSFTPSQYSLADMDHGAVTLTLQNMYDALTYSPDTTLVFMYNDDPPNTESSSSSRAHAKGMGTADINEDKGFFLVHSIPNWPPPPSPGYQYQFPDYEADYGQSLFCFNQQPSTEYTAVTQFLDIYFSNAYVITFPDAAQDAYPFLVDVLGGAHTLTATEDTFALHTLGGLRITNFAKNRKAQVDLYESMVAPYFDTDLAAETWGRGYMDNYCSGINATYTVENVDVVDASHIDTGVQWVDTKDHSKWAVSTSYGTQVTCIGDINRMESQRDRPGGTFCVELSSVHQSFLDLVEIETECPQ
eukprot:gnl/Dysnectes_brevis/1595_a1806_1878.p1 GENE.gnl/Dysnectes_brevis/1595_a1806_1878~~gnl/Dysnectes_brevis/1595_a1806_1878.p1  ORF type:complete len:373 (+),score=126.70 gnl/Dysnectes_brevis/1595_a1806_1878:99-1217(+)